MLCLTYDAPSLPQTELSLIVCQRYNPSQPMSTPLYNAPTSVDFATRMSKVLARKTKMPCYVGSSINLAGGAGGASVEEEMEAFRAIVGVVETAVQRAGISGEDT